MNQNETAPLKPLFLSVRQTAGVLRVSTKSVYRLLERNLLKASPYLRHKLISVASIEAFSRLGIN